MTFNYSLQKDHRYQRTTVVPHKEPSLHTSVKQHLDESKEKNAETVFDSSTLIDKYPELEKLPDYINDAFPYNCEVLQLDQPDTSRMTPELEMLLDHINDALPYNCEVLQLAQPDTSQMTPELEMLLDHINDALPYNCEVLQLAQPNTSNQTNLENKIKNAQITANQSNRNHPYNKTNLDRAFR